MTYILQYIPCLLQMSLCAYLQEAAAREDWVCNAVEQSWLLTVQMV